MIELIFGKRGSGKTTLAKRLVKNYSNLIIIDPLREYHGVIFYQLDDIIAYYERHGKFDIVYRPLDEDESKVFILHKLGNVSFLIEEIDLYMSANYVNEHLKALIKYGRHYNSHILGISRRTMEVSKLLTSQANRIWVSRMQENADVDYFKKLGFPEDKLRSLPEHTFIYKDF